MGCNLSRNSLFKAATWKMTAERGPSIPLTCDVSLAFKHGGRRWKRETFSGAVNPHDDEEGNAKM